jgi:hypothetical protein
MVVETVTRMIESTMAVFSCWFDRMPLCLMSDYIILRDTMHYKLRIQNHACLQISIAISGFVESTIMYPALIHPYDVGQIFHVWWDNVLTLDAVVLVVFKPGRGVIIVPIVLVHVFEVRVCGLIVPTV